MGVRLLPRHRSHNYPIVLVHIWQMVGALPFFAVVVVVVG